MFLVLIGTGILTQSALSIASMKNVRLKHWHNLFKYQSRCKTIPYQTIATTPVPDGSTGTYERVERLDSAVCRPVLILGPLTEPLINKLTSESPDKFCRCEPGEISIVFCFSFKIIEFIHLLHGIKIWTTCNLAICAVCGIILEKFDRLFCAILGG